MRRTTSHRVFTILLCLVLGLVVVACGPGEEPAAVDLVPVDDRLAEAAILASQLEQLLEGSGAPGIAVAVAEGNDEPLVAAAGLADTERMIPLRADTPFFIGSISKNLFAVVTLQLAEEGLLSLNDPLSDYLEWPRGAEVTIRMLLNHSSGIPDYFTTLSLTESRDGMSEFFSEPHPPSEIVEMMPDRDPTFDPGTRQSYSNTNALLVGMVIEKVTGKSLGEVLEERIVTPLGLENTYLYGASTLGRPRARGYSGKPGWVVAEGELIDVSFADETLPDSADGSVVSSVGDLLRYHQALRGGELLSESSWEAMRRVDPGFVNGLGYLIMSGPLGDHEGNAGKSIGHLSASVYYLDHDLFVVMMLNRSDVPLPMRRFLEMRLEAEGEPEARSFLGQPLYAPEPDEERRTKLENDLAEAQAALAANPDDPERVIWVGRRLAYLGRYRDAIRVFTQGIEDHPEEPRLYRHRGHRYITVRELDRAIADLELAAELTAGQPDTIEPDGAPNKYGIPRSTLKSNIWYHLGLAWYLKGEFERAMGCYLTCMDYSKLNDDMLVASADWLYMTYRRLGREEEAASVLGLIQEEMEILENHAYHRRLLMYKGLIEPEALLDPADLTELDLATQGYGVANWYLYNGQTDRARELMGRIVEGGYWAAFGHIAAEADLSRIDAGAAN
jgi:CubicO group peptidase (beta-lactamase class C family)